MEYVVQQYTLSRHLASLMFLYQVDCVKDVLCFPSRTTQVKNLGKMATEPHAVSCMVSPPHASEKDLGGMRERQVPYVVKECAQHRFLAHLVSESPMRRIFMCEFSDA